jgi:GNAT superfamily N-acetyltransferase
VNEYGVIEKLKREHRLDEFDCGREALNRFLKRFAWDSQQSGGAQTYVLASELVVGGYYSLVASSVSHDEPTARARRGQPRHRIPVVLLARLAVDVSVQGRGIGPALLKDALLRAASAADIIGARGLLVHAKDDNARGFYEHFNFEPSPSDPFHLFLIMKDLMRMLGK